MMWLVGIFALVIGALLGLLGGGGSILAVPVLVELAGLPGKEAIAISLLIVGATSVVGVLRHAVRGNVDWNAGLTFAPFAMLGSYVGGSLARYIPGSVLLALFAIMMVVTSAAMLRKRRDDATNVAAVGRASLWLIGAEGLAIGGFTGLVGAGGGFLVVPALMLLGGLTMHRAVGTSLLVIAAKSASGFAGYVSHVAIDYTLALSLVAMAIAGTLLGANLSSRIAADKLREGFAYFVLAMGVYMLLQPLAWPIYVVVAAAAAVVLVAHSLKQWQVHRANLAEI